MHLNVAAAPRRRAAGFTLIEIMVVVVILGILAALVLPNVMGRIGQAQATKVKHDIQGYETALSLFKLDNFKYPSTDQGLEALIKQPADPSIRNWKEGGYIRKLTKDPWGNAYNYVYPGTHGTEYDIFTLGADAQPGGDGDNADVGNWNLD
jgi:general secretion pathway protein G